MLIPSYAELMDVLNKESTENDEITSRYTIVIATAKRARQLIEGDDPMVKGKKGKPVSTAVDEIYKNKIKVVPEGEGTVLVFKKPTEENTYEKNELDSTNIEFNFTDKTSNELNIESENETESENVFDINLNNENEEELEENMF
ncbi:MAG: DNA-directed RNA polymerase subunit omega [Eubacteriales bacterium]|nr:DNA-directed RNA polymerase subunit omega [Eubacteriales bacterium]